MASESQPINDASLLRALRDEFIVKIQEEWETRWKPLGHGDTFPGLNNLPNLQMQITPTPTAW